jgi:predicted Zn-dependent protease
MPLFLRTHPVGEDRVQALTEQYFELQKQEPKADLYVGQENLRRRMPRAERAF